jgi:O-antigen/teichoic acid export membrane protein
MNMKILQFFRREIKNGAGWFTISNFIPSAVSVLMGPLILRKVGLEDYAVLSMAAYLLSLVFIYSDFGGYPHLLAAFSKQSGDRFRDLSSALVLKGALLLLSFFLLGAFALWHPRQDLLYPFLALSMIGLALPTMNAEWYLIAEKRYFQIFLSRLVLNGSLILLICAWLFSSEKNFLLFPLLNLAASTAAGAFFPWRRRNWSRPIFCPTRWRGFPW